MTQNLTSSSLSGEKPDYDKQSSSEIRADIDQTRASVGDKIDQLQARLDPNRLKQQAQETVQEMLNDTASSMTDYVKTHRDEMVTSLADSARRNPLPTALIGLGVGWLILESMAGPRPRQESGSRERRRNITDDASYYPPEEGYYPTTDWRPTGYSSPNPAGYPNRLPSGEPYYPTTGQDFSRGYGQQGSSQQGYNQQGYNQQGSSQGNREGYELGSGSSYNQYYNQQARPTSGNGQQHGQNPVAKATDAVKDSVNDMTSRAGDAMSDAKDKVGDSVNDMGQRVSNAAGDLKDRAGDVAGDLKDKVGDTMHDMGERISDTAGYVGDRFNDAMGGMRQQANEMGRQGQQQYGRASNQMDQWQHQARYEGQRRGQQVVRNLEDNPLIYGAVALAAGAALALLLPQSRTENRIFGEMRDQAMSRGQEMLDTAKGHAQQVYEEVRPDLEQTARQIVSNVTETGKQAVKDATDQLSPVVDKAMAKGKDEARSAAKEIGVDPDKLMASSQSSGNQPSSNQSSGNQASSSQTPVLNRDNLAGQWKQVKGEVKRKWGQLTDDDITHVEGDYDKLIGVIQTRYGYTREHTERELTNFFNNQTV